MSEGQRHVLPTPNFMSLAFAATNGIVSHLTDSTARDAYVSYVKEGIICDDVLAEASYGSIRTMALFHNLQNPLWKEHSFDMKEFVTYVPRALETYTDTLGRLVMETTKEIEKKTKESTASAETTTDTVPDLAKNGPFELLFNKKENTWNHTAKKDPDSLAGRLAKMTTERMFQEHFLGAELFMWVNNAKQTSAVEYVAGSSVVLQSALVSAQVDYVLDETDEYAASEENPPVAARMDVLYEVQQTYRPVAAVKKETDTSKQSAAESSSDTTENALKSSSSSSSSSTETEPSEKVTTPEPIAAEDTVLKTSIPLSKEEEASEKVSTMEQNAAEDANQVTTQEPTAEEALLKTSNVTSAAQSTSSTSSEANPASESAMTTDSSEKIAEEPRPSTEIDTSTLSAKVEEKEEALENSSPSPPPPPPATEPISPTKPGKDGDVTIETNLVVATLEGWLCGGPKGNQLRWKISQIRDAYEFS